MHRRRYLGDAFGHGGAGAGDRVGEIIVIDRERQRAAGGRDRFECNAGRYRHRNTARQITGFQWGNATGTFVPTVTQTWERGTAGRILSFTADRLTYSPDPPALYGMIQFAEGGRCMLDFTDMDEADLVVEKPMRMMFRVKDVDSNRGFRRYFWKAAPA